MQALYSSIVRWRQKRQDELIRGFRLGVVRTEKRKRGKSGDGTGDKQSVRVPSTRLPNIVRRVVYWFCLAWISGESSNLVDAENGNGMPELAIPSVGCRARLKGGDDP